MTNTAEITELASTIGHLTSEPKATGPRSTEGKATSARNAITTGVFAQSVVLHDESLEDRKAILDTWVSTFSPRTNGEAAVTAKIADVLVRLERLDGHEEIVRTQGFEAELKSSAPAKTLAIVDAALEAIRGMAASIEGITASVSFESFREVAPAIRRTIDLAENAEVPLSLLCPLKNAFNAAIVDSLMDVGPGVFQDMASTAREIESWLRIARQSHELAVESERNRLEQDPTFGDEKQLRSIDQHRARLRRELDWLLKLLGQVRVLARPDEDGSGSFCVELRVVGRPNLAPR